MILIHTLRMIVDLSIYFYFAELAAALTGGKSMLFEMLLLCICFGVLVWVQKFSQNRFILLLPVCILFLPKTFEITIANKILLAPPIIYMIYLFLKEEYGLSQDRQNDLFSASRKIFLAAGTCICLSGNYTLCFTYSVDIAKKSRDILGTPDEINEMREIYIRARYCNQATRSDLKRIKQINQMLK